MPTICYLVSQYPKLSHSFVTTEIAGLREAGITVRTFSVNRPSDEDLADEVNRTEAGSTTFLISEAKQSAPALLLFALRNLRAVRRGLIEARRFSRRAGHLRWIFYLIEALVLIRALANSAERRVHLHVHLANNGADVAHLATYLGPMVDAREWSWSLAVHGPNELADMSRYNLSGKVASARFVACITDFCRSQILAICPPERWNSIHVVRMGIQPGRFPEVERPHDDGTRYLFVGRLVAEKAPELLVDAFVELGDPNARLRIIGAGDRANALAERVAAAGVKSQVELVGAVGNEQLLEHYSWANVFCLPSFAEGLPVAIMEAMATGLPVVSSRIAGIPELVRDGRTGVLVAPSNTTELVRALKTTSSGSVRREMATDARGTVLAAHDYTITTQHLARIFVNYVCD